MNVKVDFTLRSSPHGVIDVAAVHAHTHTHTTHQAEIIRITAEV